MLMKGDVIFVYYTNFRLFCKAQNSTEYKLECATIENPKLPLLTNE
jgi:hypothetical protein